MPNSDNAQYSEWRVWFDRLIPFLENDSVLVGQSLGGVFLVKYLSENKLPVLITAVILSAAPYDDSSTNEELGSFKLTYPLTDFCEQAGKILLVYGERDPFVPLEQYHKYKDKIPEAESHLFDCEDHFIREKFPELVEIIKNL